MEQNRTKCDCGSNNTIHQKYCKKYINTPKLENYGFIDPTDSLLKDKLIKKAYETSATILNDEHS